MNPREAAILNAAATLLSTKQDASYGPAHAVRDALALADEVEMQTYPERAAAASLKSKHLISEMGNARFIAPETARAGGAA